MREYRARQRVPELLPLVALVAEMLGQGEDPEAIALALAMHGARVLPPK